MIVYRIIVDKIPERCIDCNFAVKQESYPNYYCSALNDGVDNRLGDDPYSMPFRRHDCPLYDTSECVCYSHLSKEENE